MLNCKDCNVNPVCKIFEQNEKIKNDVVISVDYCKYWVEKNYSPTTEIKHTDLRKRMDDLKNYEENLKLNIEPEYHTCEECGDYSYLCEPCAKCGKWVCPDCMVTTPSYEVMCEECYDAQ